MNMLEKVMGPGLAAPETRGMQRLRRVVIALTSVVCAGLLSIDVVRAGLGCVLTGVLFAVLLAATVTIGSVYFMLKSRRDGEWLDERCRTPGDE